MPAAPRGSRGAGQSPAVPASTVPARTARAAAAGAALVGLAYAAVSAYWAVGGTALLRTLGGVFERWGQARSAAVVAALWAVVLLKVVAAALPGLAIGRSGPFGGQPGSPRARRLVRLLAWASGAIMTAYGAVWTATGLVVQSGVLRAGAGADQRALRWHAYLWDPWFLLWGLLTIIALIASRPRRRPGPARSAGAG